LLDPQNLIGDLVGEWIDQFNFLKREVDLKINPPDAPKLNSIASWEPFRDTFDLYMSYYRTVVGGVPLNFYTNINMALTVVTAIRAKCTISKQAALLVVETVDWRFNAPLDY
jgi:hypothetical protein